METVIEKAREAARQHLKANPSVSQADLARSIGRAPSTFNQYMNGTYVGKVADLAEDLMKHLGTTEIGSDGQIQVKNLKRVHEVLRRTKRCKAFSVIIGAPGYGKTFGAQTWCEQDDETYFIRVTGVMSRYPLIQEIGFRLGQLNSHNRMPEHFKGVQNALMQRCAHPMLIFDEADRLSIPGLELLRDLYDTTNVSICLMGEEFFLHTLQFGRTRKENLARIYRRVSIIRRLDDLDFDDVQAILTHEKLRKVSKAGVSEIVENIRQKGGIGILTQPNGIIETAREIAEKNNRDIDDKVMAEAFRRYTVKGMAKLPRKTQGAIS